MARQRMAEIFFTIMAGIATANSGNAQFNGFFRVPPINTGPQPHPAKEYPQTMLLQQAAADAVGQARLPLLANLNSQATDELTLTLQGSITGRIGTLCREHDVKSCIEIESKQPDQTDDLSDSERLSIKLRTAFTNLALARGIVNEIVDQDQSFLDELLRNDKGPMVSPNTAMTMVEDVARFGRVAAGLKDDATMAQGDGTVPDIVSIATSDASDPLADEEIAKAQPEMQSLADTAYHAVKDSAASLLETLDAAAGGGRLSKEDIAAANEILKRLADDYAAPVVVPKASDGDASANYVELTQQEQARGLRPMPKPEDWQAGPDQNVQDNSDQPPQATDVVQTTDEVQTTEEVLRAAEKLIDVTVALHDDQHARGEVGTEVIDRAIKDVEATEQLTELLSRHFAVKINKPATE